MLTAQVIASAKKQWDLFKYGGLWKDLDMYTGALLFKTHKEIFQLLILHCIEIKTKSACLS